MEIGTRKGLELSLGWGRCGLGRNGFKGELGSGLLDVCDEEGTKGFDDDISGIGDRDGRW